MVDQFIPNTLEMTLYIEPPDRSGLVHVVLATLALYENDNPIWFEHPSGRAVDCVAIPVIYPPDLNFKSVAMNRHDWDQRLEAEAGMECFIIGYPKGLTGAATTPIWKRASVAS